MAFEVAIYTDVTAAEAIDGVDGFNFQAVSPGLTGGDQQLIRESLLHRVIPSWSLGHDALSHPATCAFQVRDGRGYLSRGLSTGATNSGRPGNQVTQVITTSDPDDFVPYRPAQLYGAVRWSLEKARGKTVDPWVTPLEIRPEFEVDALRELVVGDAWAQSVLPHYLAMIDAATAPEPKKAVLLHTDLDEVMRWIALGTLFVDAERARSLRFRALVDDPWRVDAPLVGVSPEFGTADLSAAHVLDLARRTVPDIEPGEATRTRAAWFVEHDASDALNAVETARRWEAPLGAVLANDAAGLVSIAEPVTAGAFAWRSAVSAIDGLAEAGFIDDLSLYGEDLCEAAVTYGPRTAEEFALAGRAVRRTLDLELDEVATGMLVPLLEALAAAPGQAGAWARELSGAGAPVRWAGNEERAAAGAFLGELLGSAPAEALPELLAAARVVGAPVGTAPLRAAVDRLSALWLRDAELGRDRWRDWLAGAEVIAVTARRLVNAFRAGDSRAVAALVRGDWDFLVGEQRDPDLGGWLLAGQIGRLPAAEREGPTGRATTLPGEAWRVVLADSDLYRNTSLWAGWVSRHGYTADLMSVLRTEVERALRSAPGAERDVALADWPPLMESLVGAPDRRVAQVADEFARVQVDLDALCEEVRKRPRASFGAVLSRIRPLAPLLLEDIGWLLLNSENPDEKTRLARTVSPWGPDAMRSYVVHLAENRNDIQAIELALRLRSDPEPQVSAAGEAALDRLVESRPRLVNEAKGRIRTRGELERYLRQRSQGPQSRQRTPRFFGWRRGR
ncbi:GAP1-N2 domain-containing protein [Nocardiopsis valliformis]|uniref:GAP1-N2 domain-containing protein n=1 Tax=Nocardiopsis valliformis TaxID=239974 RepID=UPI0003499AC8|nr:hypothetical protein [Nocardiopsis valliformis]